MHAAVTTKFHHIELTPLDYEYGRHVGFARHRAWEESGRNQNSFGCEDIGPATQLLGTIAELAVARALGVRWTATLLPSRSDWDIDGVCEVRCGSKHHHRLLLRPGQIKMDAPYVHLTTNNDGRSWLIHGWAMARDVMIEKYLIAPGAADRPPAYFVPSDVLYSLDSFVR